ncbi:MAG: hypothetical protein ACU0DT_17735 [Albimonas sp.]|uniref:hypothetical protein n=1 Tax=Albimonas sp. TaxID=1872425 RepID=UPI0040568C86|tara:strand:- start:186 stop:395 length:210 start_codon:yes stop_codon:yes gene_type:complete
MSRAPAPQMPTPTQVREAMKLAREIDPAARIARIGPDGVSFDYPGGKVNPSDPVETWFAEHGQGAGEGR